jgi:hypothetical protein
MDEISFGGGGRFSPFHNSRKYAFGRRTPGSAAFLYYLRVLYGPDSWAQVSA